MESAMPKTLKILILAFVLLLLLGGAAVLGQYLGGMTFANMQKLPPSSVSIFTLHDYWQAFGDIKAVKRSLAICTALSIAVPVLPVVFLVLLAIKSRTAFAQFGNARFATRRDIKAAGLLED
jgi:type IV secretory pathway TraG/TraD family ATPase VirD4